VARRSPRRTASGLAAFPRRRGQPASEVRACQIGIGHANAYEQPLPGRGERAAGLAPYLAPIGVIDDAKRAESTSVGHLHLSGVDPRCGCRVLGGSEREEGRRRPGQDPARQQYSAIRRRRLHDSAPLEDRLAGRRRHRPSHGRPHGSVWRELNTLGPYGSPGEGSGIPKWFTRTEPLGRRRSSTLAGLRGGQQERRGNELALQPVVLHIGAPHALGRRLIHRPDLLR
jgi:hypothetical protein